MKKRNLLITLIATAVSAALALPAMADDLTIVSSITVRGKTSKATSYLTDERILTSDGQTDTIIDFSGERLVTIDHKKKRWSETTFAEIRSAMAEAEKMLAEMPPMVSQMLGDITDARVEKLGSSRQVAGHTCHNYRISLGEKISYDLCAAPSVEPPMNYYEARKMGNLMMGPMASRMSKIFDAMAKIDGYPIAMDMSLQLMGMNTTVDQEAVEIKSGVPTGVFEVPSGYKKKKSPI